jgi:hypothetical protein
MYTLPSFPSAELITVLHARWMDTQTPKLYIFLTGHRFDPEDALNRVNAFLLSLFQTATKYSRDIFSTYRAINRRRLT